MHIYGTPTLSYVFRCVLCADVTSLCAVLLRLYRGILPLCVVYTQIYYLQTSLYALYFPLYHVLSLIYTVQVSVCAVKTSLYGVCSLCSKLYDDITTMRRENRRTQASSLRVAILILCSREEARFPPWPVLCHPC